MDVSDPSTHRYTHAHTGAGQVVQDGAGVSDGHSDWRQEVRLDHVLSGAARADSRAHTERETRTHTHTHTHTHTYTHTHKDACTYNRWNASSAEP